MVRLGSRIALPTEGKSELWKLARILLIALVTAVLGGFVFAIVVVAVTV